MITDQQQLEMLKTLTLQQVYHEAQPTTTVQADPIDEEDAMRFDAQPFQPEDTSSSPGAKQKDNSASLQAAVN